MARVLITGANRGIGLEFVKQFLNKGYEVIAACRKPEQAVALQALAGAGVKILALELLSQASREAFAAAIAEEPIDIFLNNAGIYGPKGTAFDEVDEETWLEVMRVNAIVPFLITRAVLPSLEKGAQKKLVFISSKMGSIADNDSGDSYIYRSSKTALNQVVKSLSIDLQPRGMAAFCFHPGWVRTDMGGPNALIDTQTSVQGMLGQIESLGMDQSGGFFNFDGSPIPW